MTKMGQKRTAPKGGIKKKLPKDKPMDDMWAKIIKWRDDYKCGLCGRTKKQGWLMNACHYMGRVYRSTRWELDNGACLCYVCHQDVDNDADLKQDFFGKKIGAERRDELTYIARTRIKPDKEAILKDLTEKIGGLE